MIARDPGEPRNIDQLQYIIDGVSEILSIIGEPIEKPGERRADYALPEGFVLTDDNESAIRRIASEKLGIGISADITLDNVELDEYGVAIIEGGQSHKMLAELLVALQTDHKGPIVITSTEYRVIKQTADDPKVKERANTALLLGINEDEVGDTELAVAVQVVESMQGFEIALDEDAPEDLVKLGTINGRDLFIYSIPRMYYETDTGEQKYRQPNISDQATYIRNIIGASEVALITSSTYYSSRTVAAKGAYKVAAYCSATLARVRGNDPTDAKPDINQIISEVAKTEIELSRL